MCQNTFPLWRFNADTLLSAVHQGLNKQGCTKHRHSPNWRFFSIGMQWDTTAGREINKHSQSNSFRVWNTFRGKGRKGWNLNLTSLMNSSLTILVWQFCSSSCRTVLTLEGVTGNLKFLVHWMHRVASLQLLQSLEASTGICKASLCATLAATLF